MNFQKKDPNFTWTSFSTRLDHVANGLVPIPCPFRPTKANNEMKPSGVRNLCNIKPKLRSICIYIPDQGF